MPFLHIGRNYYRSAGALPSLRGRGAKNTRFSVEA